MKGMCDKCPRRSYCTELCPEAKAYANQDFIPMKEVLLPIPVATIGGLPYRDISKLSSHDKKILILRLYQDGRSIHDIAIHAEVSRTYIRKVLHNWKLEGGGTKNGHNTVVLLRKK